MNIRDNGDFPHTGSLLLAPSDAQNGECSHCFPRPAHPLDAAYAVFPNMEDTLSAINGRRRRREAMNGPLAQRAFTPALFYPAFQSRDCPHYFVKLHQPPVYRR